MRTALPLQPGDKVGIAAPSGAVNRTRFMRGVRVLEQWGLQPVFRSDIFKSHRYFAGTHRRRLNELQSLIDRSDIKAILFARGGFGLHHILPQLKFGRLRRYPKRIIGYSDLTLLLDRIGSQTELMTYYGPTLGSLGAKEGTKVRRDYKRILFGKELGPTWKLAKSSILKSGKATGTLVGGCLSLISMSVGTRYEMKTRNSILLLEDINESLYRFERLLLHLKQSGLLTGVRGMLVSSIELSREKSLPQEWKGMLKEILKGFKGPVVFNFPFGHLNKPFTLPIGQRVSLDTRKGELSLL